MEKFTKDIFFVAMFTLTVLIIYMVTGAKTTNYFLLLVLLGAVFTNADKFTKLLNVLNYKED